MPTQVNMLEAKNQLSKLVKAAAAGEDVIIASNGVPMVRLVPVRARPKSRKPGAWSRLPAAASVRLERRGPFSGLGFARARLLPGLPQPARMCLQE